jgi:glycolate oxidase iron-sulfur subunit
VQSIFFSQVNSATARVLAAEGFEVVVPQGQGCCGALSWHAGRRSEAARLAKKTVGAFKSAGVEYVVVNAAGCGSAMKEYAALLAGNPGYEDGAAWLAARTLDFSELLASVEPRAKRQTVDRKVAYHDACHLAHGQGIRAQPRALLQGIPGLQLLEIGDEFCCGSAGIYNLVQPDAARELGTRKAAAIAATKADILVSTNPGCLMQVRSALRRAGSGIETAHLAEILDISITGRGAANP